VRNPGSRPLLVDVSRAGFGRSLRGRARIRTASDVGWLLVRPRRLRLAARSVSQLRVSAAPASRITPGDHPALVLLTTRPLGARHVRVRLRVGVVVVLHVPGRIVRRLYLQALSVRGRPGRRILELRLVNRGNVTERLGGKRLRVALLRHGRVLATLRARPIELLPHSAGIAEFRYRGRARGVVTARVELPPQLRRNGRSFRIRL
jgi:translation initiation factor IF-1